MPDMPDRMDIGKGVIEVALTLDEIKEQFGLTQSGDELVELESGDFIAYVCDECGRVRASGATLNMGTYQPEYCRC